MGSACIIVVRACLFPVYIPVDICWVYGAEVGELIADYIYTEDGFGREFRH